MDNSITKNNTTKNEFVENLYNFSQITFTDSVSVENFKNMLQETVNRCFEDNNYLAYMSDVSIYMSILKYCSNFPVENFNEEDLYLICVYSNLKDCINNIINNNSNNKLSFIINTLKDNILYEKDKRLNRSKLDDIIGILINFIGENIDDISSIINKALTETNNNISNNNDPIKE